MFEIKLNHYKQWVSSGASLDWICFSTSFCKEVIKCNGFKQSKWHVGWENRKASLKRCHTQRRRNYHIWHWRPYHFHISTEVLLSKARSPASEVSKKDSGFFNPWIRPRSEGHCVSPVYDGKRWIQSLDCFSNARFVQNHQWENRRTGSQPTGSTPQSQPDGHQWPRPATTMGSTATGWVKMLLCCLLHTEKLGLFLYKRRILQWFSFTFLGRKRQCWPEDPSKLTNRKRLVYLTVI